MTISGHKGEFSAGFAVELILMGMSLCPGVSEKRPEATDHKERTAVGFIINH